MQRRDRKQKEINHEQKYYGIEIEDYVWLTTNVMVLPSCRHIGYKSVVGSGSVVVKDVPAMAVMTGNPAYKFKDRKQVHTDLCVESLLGGDFKAYEETWKWAKTEKLTTFKN